MNSNERPEIQPLLEKYLLTAQVPKDVQEYMISRKGKIFKKIARRTGMFSITFGLLSALYFWMKKIGITITVSKILISAVVISGLSTAAYVSAPFILSQNKNKVEAEKEKPAVVENAVTKNEKGRTAKEPATTHHTIGIISFKSSSISNRKEIQNIQNLIMEKTISLKGNTFISKSDAGRHTYDHRLFGTIEKAEGITVITVKITDSKTSSVRFIASETAKDGENINGACQRIAEKISLSTIK